jgi:ATP-binding cassette subfamily A (ABC1) protein 3
MSFLSASFVVFLIKERETNAKHLQVVSGVRVTVFWLASFLFDIVNFVIPCIFLCIVLLAFQNEDFKSAEMLGYFFLLLLFYGWSVIPFMYLFSFAFTIPSSGFTRMVMFNVFTGMATILAISILQVPDLDLVNVADSLEWVFMLFPNFNLGYGISLLSTNKQLHKMCPNIIRFGAEFCLTYPDNPCCTKCMI